MKIVVPLLTILLLVSACASPDTNQQPESTEADVLAVQQTVDDWLNKGIGSHDATVIGSYLTPTFGLVEPFWMERQTLIEWVSSFEETLSYTLTDWHTTVHGDVAWTSLVNNTTIMREGQEPRHVQATETGVLVKQADGRWLIDRYHSTAIENPK
jgi:ketosteroid isomerase-like protein